MLIPGVSLQSQQSIWGCYRGKTSHPSGKTTFKENRREQLDNRDQEEKEHVGSLFRENVCKNPSRSQEYQHPPPGEGEENATNIPLPPSGPQGAAPPEQNP